MRDRENKVEGTLSTLLSIKFEVRKLRDVTSLNCILSKYQNLYCMSEASLMIGN
ncbi:4954_t:CDS:2 [Funneliformis mosseae]|uniref:4954_t:CDS:1 n=1 Tax=Funneliformis mosseae TaxID=27381 RepID=A0A9N9G1T7_FUNMO|nr:4954_t:CDS:2 [Funneliformis mosseae]